jgi:hypothetical protein
MSVKMNSETLVIKVGCMTDGKIAKNAAIIMPARHAD